MSKEYNMLLGINELEILSEPVEEDIYIVDKILPPGVTLLCGHQKIGKSWLALKLCLCATRGVDLWGYKTKHCKALYCCLEDTRKRIRKRYDALVKAAEELQETAPAGWLDFRFQCPKLDNGLVEELEQYVGDNPECKLIVIDTLLMITPRMNDSPYANDYNNIVALKKFADKYEIAIVLIHHTRKLKAADPFDEILGTTGLNGAADAMMILSRKGRSANKGTLRYTGRDIGDEEIDLVFHDGDWQIMDGEPAMDTTPGNTPFVQSILSVIGNGSKWEGTATDLAEAVGGETTPGWMTRRLKEHREELEQCGIAFINDRESSSRRSITITRNG